MPLEAVENELDINDLPDDYAAYNAARDAQEAGRPVKAPAAGGETTPSSEPAADDEDVTGQIPPESETEEETQREEETAPTEPEPQKKETALEKRMRKLSGHNREASQKIAELQARLDALQNGETDEETPEEVASSPETAGEPAPAALVRPKLSDFEDDPEKGNAWDQWEAALEAYNDEKTARALKTALDKQAKEIAKATADKELAQARANAQAEWNEAASRFPNFNEAIANPKVQINQAMENVMRMNPKAGTAICMYLAEHPEESLRIATSTLVRSTDREQAQIEFGVCMAKVGMEFGTIQAKLDAPKPAAAPKSGVAAVPKGAPAAQPTTKKISTAHPPPAQIRPAVAAALRFDTSDDKTASDWKKWNDARERELAAKKR